MIEDRIRQQSMKQIGTRRLQTVCSQLNPWPCSWNDECPASFFLFGSFCSRVKLERNSNQAYMYPAYKKKFVETDIGESASSCHNEMEGSQTCPPTITAHKGEQIPQKKIKEMLLRKGQSMLGKKTYKIFSGFNPILFFYR